MNKTGHWSTLPALILLRLIMLSPNLPANAQFQSVKTADVCGTQFQME